MRMNTIFKNDTDSERIKSTVLDAISRNVKSQNFVSWKHLSNSIKLQRVLQQEIKR
jgi:hypothetical protein